MSRRIARENAFLFLYEIQIQLEDIAAQRERFLESHAMSEADEAFFDSLVQGVEKHREELDAQIAPNLRDWKFERLPLVEKTILRLAVYELSFETATPVNVIIAEAVVFAKTYSDEKARSYINAVLGRLARELRAHE